MSDASSFFAALNWILYLVYLKASLILLLDLGDLDLAQHCGVTN